MKKLFKIIIVFGITLIIFQNLNPEVKLPVFNNKTAESKITAFAKKYGISENEWPKELIELLRKNPESEEFVLNYPLMKNTVHEIAIDEYKSGTVPLFLQWDMRWGYETYGSSVIGLSGCGPVCLSMVCVYLFDDTSYNPSYIADFSIDNGYCVPGSGSSWSLISEGGKALGLDVTEIPLDKERIMRNLNVGNPIICVVGPGDFTDEGHFIVMSGTDDGKIKINDPNSIKNSEKLWDFDEIKSQILNLWVCRL